MISPLVQRNKLMALQGEMLTFLSGEPDFAEIDNRFAEAHFVEKTPALKPLPGWQQDLPPGPLTDRLAVAADYLCWQQNPNYHDQIFLERYRYCEVVGPKGHFLSDHLAAGFLCLAPHTLYPDHSHPARETYFVLSPNSEWKCGNSDWVARQPGEKVLHPSHDCHAMRTHHSPLLALYIWQGQIHEPARLGGSE